MPRFALHCSHEQIPPSRLLRSIAHAEEAGFTGGMSSDHFAPWSARQGESGFAWSFLGAALAPTSLPFGVVNAPGQRYHPAIIAQAAATLCEMFPERLWIALGTGEASNEHITGERWPPKDVRTARLRECVDVMRALFAGEEVSHDGHVVVDRARLWTLPATPPAAAVRGGEREDRALGRRVGRRAGDRQRAGRAPAADARRVRVRRVARSCRCTCRGRRRRRRRCGSRTTSGARTSSIRRSAGTSRRPRPSTRPRRSCAPRTSPSKVLVSSDLSQHVEWLQELAALGFDDIALHHVGQDLDPFIDAFGEHVLPELAA